MWLNKNIWRTLRKGPKKWNEWRQKHPSIHPLSGADLTRADSHRANLSGAHLNSAHLSFAKDTAMWVHLFRLIGALWIVVRFRYGSMGFYLPELQQAVCTVPYRRHSGKLFLSRKA